jgi:hypothetical protein
MTDNELQTIVEAVLESLKTNGKTIEQLTAVTTMGTNDYIELNGGRKVKYSVLYDQLYTAAQAVIEASETGMWAAINALRSVVENLNEVYCTEAEYNEMVYAGTIDPNTKYYIYES